MENSTRFSSGNDTGAAGDTWYVDNYLLLKDYYDRTISRIAARCVRQGNIAMEEYPFYGYILDVLEEISETGDYIMEHPDLYPYLEKKLAGGVNALKKSLREFQTELQNNASPDMVKQDKDELEKMKQALGAMDKSVDPTVGAGMSMDQVVEKLMQNQGMSPSEQPEDTTAHKLSPRPSEPSGQPQGNSRLQAPRQPQAAKPQQPNQPARPQGGQPAKAMPASGTANAPRPSAAPAQPKTAPQSPFKNGNQ